VVTAGGCHGDANIGVTESAPSRGHETDRA